MFESIEQERKGLLKKVFGIGGFVSALIETLNESSKGNRHEAEISFAFGMFCWFWVVGLIKDGLNEVVEHGINHESKRYASLREFNLYVGNEPNSDLLVSLFDQMGEIVRKIYPTVEDNAEAEGEPRSLQMKVKRGLGSSCSITANYFHEYVRTSGVHTITETPEIFVGTFTFQIKRHSSMVLFLFGLFTLVALITVVLLPIRDSYGDSWAGVPLILFLPLAFLLFVFDRIATPRYFRKEILDTIDHDFRVILFHSGLVKPPDSQLGADYPRVSKETDANKSHPLLFVLLLVSIAALAFSLIYFFRV